MRFIGRRRQRQLSPLSEDIPWYQALLGPVLAAFSHRLSASLINVQSVPDFGVSLLSDCMSLYS